MEIGDEDKFPGTIWTWNADEVAEYLIQSVNAPNWGGPILVRACAESVANFSASLAIALRARGRFGGLWCYSYNRSVSAGGGYPSPNNMARQAELQGTQV